MLNHCQFIDYYPDSTYPKVFLQYRLFEPAFGEKKQLLVKNLMGIHFKGEKDIIGDECPSEVTADCNSVCFVFPTGRGVDGRQAEDCTGGEHSGQSEGSP